MIGNLACDYGTPAVREHPLNAGCLAWWMFLPNDKGSATFRDLLGGVPATKSSSPTIAFNTIAYPNAIGPSSLTTAGANDGWTVPRSLGTSSNWSFAFWSFYTTFTAYVPIILTGGGGSGSHCGVHSSSDGSKWTIMWNGDPTTYNWAGGPSILFNQWQYVVGTASGSSTTIWTFTTKGAIASGTNTYSLASTQTLDAVSIARDSGFTTRSWPGYVTDIRVYNRALTQPDAVALFNESAFGYPNTLRRIPVTRWRNPNIFNRSAAVAATIPWMITGDFPSYGYAEA